VTHAPGGGKVYTRRTGRRRRPSWPNPSYARSRTGAATGARGGLRRSGGRSSHRRRV